MVYTAMALWRFLVMLNVYECNETCWRNRAVIIALKHFFFLNGTIGDG